MRCRNALYSDSDVAQTRSVCKLYVENVTLSLTVHTVHLCFVYGRPSRFRQFSWVYRWESRANLAVCGIAIVLCWTSIVAYLLYVNLKACFFLLQEFLCKSDYSLRGSRLRHFICLSTFNRKIPIIFFFLGKFTQSLFFQAKQSFKRFCAAEI